MSKRQERVNIINLLYRHFLLNHSVLTTRQEVNDFSQEIIIEEQQQINQMLNYLDEIILILNQLLKNGWTFERLSNYHKAVLVYSVFELKYQKLKKAIVINEALEILKKYGEDSDISYVNKILDQLSVS